MPHSALSQPEGDHEKFLHKFHTEADQVWKDRNEIIFSYQLKYDAQLVAFITTVDGTWSQGSSHPFLCYMHPLPLKFWVSELDSLFRGSIW